MRRVTCRLKFAHGNSAAHPWSWSEVRGTTPKGEFPDEGELGGSSKPPVCSASEPIGSLVIKENGVVNSVEVGESFLARVFSASGERERSSR